MRPDTCAHCAHPFLTAAGNMHLLLKGSLLASLLACLVPHATFSHPQHLYSSHLPCNLRPLLAQAFMFYGDSKNMDWHDFFKVKIAVLKWGVNALHALASSTILLSGSLTPGSARTCPRSPAPGPLRLRCAIYSTGPSFGVLPTGLTCTTLGRTAASRTQARSPILRAAIRPSTGRLRCVNKCTRAGRAMWHEACKARGGRSS